MKHAQRSWLSLVSFCAVTGVLAALGSAVMLAGASLTFAAAEPAHGAGASAIADASVVQTMEQPAASQTVKPRSTTQPVDDNGSASSRTFAGMITDSRCGARHPMNSGKSSAECVRSCVRNGARYVLVDGEKIYALEGKPVRLGQLAGERVNVVGMLEGDTINVEAVTQE